MKYILEGNDSDVAKIVRENRIRVERGLVSFTPFNEETSEGFVDDDSNGIPNIEDHNSSEEEFFNNESYEPSEKVRKVLLEPLKKPEDEGTMVTDTKDVNAEDGKSAVSKDEKKPKGKKPKS